MAVLQEYKCPCCGGAIAFDSTAQRMKCPYCDNVMIMPEQFSGMYFPDYIIPFKKTKKEACFLCLYQVSWKLPP